MIQRDMESKSIITAGVFIIILAIGYFVVSNSVKDKNPPVLPYNSTNTVETTTYQAEPTVDPNSWTLFLYSSTSPDMDSLQKRTNNIDSKEACIKSGITYTTNGGSYECAYGCKYKKEYKSEVCERTCDHGGCRE